MVVTSKCIIITIKCLVTITKTLLTQVGILDYVIVITTVQKLVTATDHIVDTNKCLNITIKMLSYYNYNFVYTIWYPKLCKIVITNMQNLVTATEHIFNTNKSLINAIKCLVEITKT